MTELQASRTLVKSPPELWAECSDAASLARHLDGFGEIRITRLDPETTVAWEGERARGTVRIEPAGWGTKVVLTATAVPSLAEEAPAADEAARGPSGDGPAGGAVAAAAPIEDPVLATEPVQDAVAAEGASPEPLGVDPPAVAYSADSPAAPPAGVASPPRRRRFARLLAFLRGEHEPEALLMNPAHPEPVAVDRPEAEVGTGPPAPEVIEPAPAPPEAVEPAPAPEPPPSPPPTDTEAALAAALESLGQAHHRPYSRA